MTTQMRGFGIKEPAYEQAIHAFSGGFMHLGHACALLTGAALAAGFLSRARFDDDEIMFAATLYATMQLSKALPELAGSVNCREITKELLSKLSGRLCYVLRGKGRMCGRLHLRWAPQAQELIDTALTEFSESGPVRGCANCAVQTMRKIVSSVGMREEDSILVAGLAGGVGLLGNVCGALAAGVFAMSSARCLCKDAGKRDSRIRGSFQELVGSSYRGSPNQLRLAFVDRFGSELYIQILNRQFQDIVDHSTFVEQGGCQEVIEFVAKWVAHNSSSKTHKTMN